MHDPTRTRRALHGTRHGTRPGAERSLIRRLVSTSVVRALFATPLVAALALGCGSSSKARQSEDTRPPATTVLGDDVADEGDFAGTVTAFERRLERLEPGDEDYAPTLERLALAHVEYADALEAGEAEPEDPQTRPVDAVRSQRKQAVARYQELIETAPDYEGVPASLLLLAYEQQALGMRDDAEKNFEKLAQQSSDTELAAEAMLALAEIDFEAARFEDARAHYDAVVAADPASERAAYARYMLAWIDFNTDEFDAAFDAMVEVAQDAKAAEQLADQARVDAVKFYASTTRPPAEAEATLRPLMRDSEELNAALRALAKLYRNMGRADAASEVGVE